MSSPHLSFRLNHYQLAKMLRILLTLEPNQPISSFSQAAKIVIVDWISKHTMNQPLEVSQSDVEAIKIISNLPVEQINPYTTFQKLFQPQQQPHHQQQAKQILQKSAQQIQRDLDDERLFNELRREATLAQQLKNARTNEQIDIIANTQPGVMPEVKPEIKPRIKPSEFHDPNITDSIINTVTDFSPPKDWIEQD